MTHSDSTPPSSLPQLAGYTLVETLYEGIKTVVYRAIQHEKQHSVVIKVLSQKYPSFSELVQFRNQYTITHNLSIPGIIRPLSLEPYGNGYALVMEDVEGTDLGQYAQRYPLSLVEILGIAIQLTDILHDLHRHRVIHKDIKPANILIHPDTQQIKLIDFSIASLLPKETQAIQSPKSLEGTLAYLAPEQTGRMNRAIDYRTDFYALGVTLYQLLTGQLPFTSDDPLELIHCHMAQLPLPLHEFKIPNSLSAIVLKLMAKNAEDRYQSSLGLKYDLQQCLTQLQERGDVTDFALAQRDVCDRFLIPEKLYGREANVKTLLDAFNRVAEGTSELILVAGFSGIGKTAVVNEVHKPITRQNGYFIKGKFDQFNRSTPLSAFVQAFRSLMGQILSESDAQLKQWKANILDTVGENAQVLIDVIPELERILGPQPPAPQLDGSAAQNRFNRLFQKFIAVFTTPEHPLVLFLDDLQWSDSASLNLIKVLMGHGETGYFLLLGAYRDNEVSPAHPLMLTLRDLEKNQATLATIILDPLASSHINQLVAETLSCSSELAQPLTELVYQKTQGNPFFTTQFLTGLHEDHLITFNLNLGYWECDLVQVRGAALTDDVVKFMAQRLQKLPETTQTVLKLAACIGNQFDLETVAIAAEKPQEDLATDLWWALQEGLVLPMSEAYKFFQGSLGESTPQTITAGYRFLHDRVQQAAYSLIDPDETTAVHLKIGRQLRDSHTGPDWDSHIFDIVNHLNRGMALIESPQEREQLAQLNWQAGANAKRSAAYSAAMAYLKIGLSLLTPHCWQRQYVLCFELHHLAAEMAYLLGDLEYLNQMVGAGLQAARTPIDRSQFHEVQILALVSQNQLREAALYGLKALRTCWGIRLPENPSKLQTGIGLLAILGRLLGKPPKHLLTLPPMTHPETLAICKLLSVMGSAAGTGLPALVPILTFKSIALNLKYGTTPDSFIFYMVLAFAFCEKLGQIEAGYDLGKATVAFCHRNNLKTTITKIFFLWNYFVAYRKESRKEILPSLLDTYKTALDVGELEYGTYCFIAYFRYAYETGYNLGDLKQELMTSRTTVARLNQDSMARLHDLYCQLLENLTTLTPDVCTLTGQFFDETGHLDNRILLSLGTEKLVLAVLFQRYGEAYDHLQLAEQLVSYGEGSSAVIRIMFYGALLHLQHHPRPATQKAALKRIQKRIQTSRKRLQKIATSAPMNYAHQHLLLEAEYHRVLGQFSQAGDYYDRAIAQANDNGFLQEEAFANELAATFYLSQGRQTIASGYMQDAYYGYSRWGAQAKVADLETRYPELLRPILQTPTASGDMLSALMTIVAPNHSIQTGTHHTYSGTILNQTLDFASILEASQVLSSTIQLDELLCQLTKIILQNSGGDRCALILPDQDADWQVRAFATSKETQLCIEPVDNHRDLPVKLIHYVKNTQDIVVFNDLDTDLPVVDEYLQQRHPNSVLCLPIRNQGHLIGILYLENCSTSGVFTKARILVLNFLCAQAAISLENARLYQQSKYYAQQLEQFQLQMVQNEKMATLGNLVAGVAHEVNNPIGFLNGSINHVKNYVEDLFKYLHIYQLQQPPNDVVQASAEEIDRDFLLEDLPKLLDSMQDATNRIKGISTSLRTFSRADTEHKVSASLHDGLNSTLLILKYRLKANGQRPAIQVIKNYGDLTDIVCFPGQLNQVFMNILANAIDMFDDMAEHLSFQELENTPQEITIQTAHLVKQDAVEIRISDNGTGIPNEVKARMFDPLFTTKKVDKGTGLGLAIARQIIIETHGGTLGVQSTVGQGTEFCIQLPLSD